jgi:hypothetical protein
MDCYPHPLVCPDDVFNIWTPFRAEQFTDVKPNKEGLEMFLNHIKIICNHDEQVYDYFIKWIAQMFQFPAIKTICPVIIGKKGDGKSTVIVGIRKMMGDDKVLETTTPSRDVWGNFNELMLDTFFVNINELSKSDFKAGEQQFKALVTDSFMTINPKGIKSFKSKSFHRVAITTNKDDPIDTSDDERRTLVIRASDELIGNKDYFNKLYAYFEDKETIKAMYDYFMQIPDLQNFHIISTPVTEHQKQLAKLSRSPIENFINDLVEENIDKKEINISAKKLFEKFSDWKVTNDVDFNMNSVKFGVHLNLLKIDGIENERRRDGMYRILDIIKLKKHFKIVDIDKNTFN